MEEIKLFIGGPEDYRNWAYVDTTLDDDQRVVSASATEIVVSTAVFGTKVEFHGDFTVTGGVVTGGTMTGFDVFAGTTVVIKGSGYSTPGAALFQAIQGYPHDEDPFDALVLDTPHKMIGSTRDDYNLFGSDGDDLLLGRAGNDFLYGDVGDDVLKGGKGDDFLSGWEGFDKLWGGPGHDSFAFEVDPLAAVPTTFNRIKDFVPGEDLIVLQFIMKDAPGPAYLPKQFFHKGTEADTPEQVVIYDKKSGKVMIDLDGSDPGAQFTLAKVDPGTKLNAHDLYVDTIFQD